MSNFLHLSLFQSSEAISPPAGGGEHEEMNGVKVEAEQRGDDSLQLPAEGRGTFLKRLQLVFYHFSVYCVYKLLN